MDDHCPIHRFKSDGVRFNHATLRRLILESLWSGTPFNMGTDKQGFVAVVKILLDYNIPKHEIKKLVKKDENSMYIFNIMYNGNRRLLL